MKRGALWTLRDDNYAGKAGPVAAARIARPLCCRAGD
jgi:hypothetical protein